MGILNIEKLTNLSNQSNEAYKALRTNIHLCGDDKKVIALTSCLPNEGKTMLTMNIAKSFTDNGKKVLLIDADLRKRFVLGRVALQGKLLGLTDYLAGECKVSEMIWQTTAPNLHIIPAGAIASNPSELLSSASFTTLVERLKDYYDYIFIDTPPLGLVIDAAVIAKVCDGAVLVVEHNRIRRKFIQDVKDQLERTDCKILGAVLNKVDARSGYYGSYRGKYYGHYYDDQTPKRASLHA